MSNSQLLKMYKALEGITLGQRVHGAVIKQAHYLSGNETANEVDRQFADLVLSDPMRQWQPMLIEIAANGTIQDNLSIDPSGNIDDRAVADTDIEYVVGFSWNKVATKSLPPVA